MTSHIRAVPFVVMAAPVFLTVSSPSSAAAQQSPPESLPLQEVQFPDFLETTLSNGARVLVVPSDEVPLVTINVVLPGGTSADPAGREGLATLAAQLLTQGTGTRTNEDVAEALDFLGSTLGAGASADFLSVSLGSLTGALDESLAIMADAVVNPVFPSDRLELLRTQTLSALQVELSSAAAVASRAFLQAVYGEHPYARQPTPLSVESITRDDLVAFHNRYFTPAAAMFVVAGDVTLEEVTSSLDRAFRGWQGPAVEVAPYPQAADRASAEVLLVHKPGSVQAEVRIGHLLTAATHEEWTVLSVANQVLGGGPSARLFQVLREDRGYTYGASSSLSRRQGQGYFQAAMAVRNEVLEPALTDMIREIGKMRDQLVPPAELQDTKDFLVGSFPLQIETPQQVASRVMTNRLLGLPEDAIETYRSRVAALDAESVRDSFRRYVDPAKMAIVVVGDAAVLREQVQSFGPVTLLDVAGNVLAASDLAPQGRSVELSGRNLTPMRLSYLVFFQGNQVGTTDRIVDVGEDGTLRFASQAQLGPQQVDQEVTVGMDALDFRSSRMSISMPGQAMGGEVRMDAGRIVGSLTSPGGSQPVDMEVPEGVVVSDMLELAVWVAELQQGTSLELPLANVQLGTVENVTLTVLGREEITVPAGTFDVWRIRVQGSEAQTLWARVEAPHVVVQLEPAGQPIMVQLSALGDGN